MIRSAFARPAAALLLTVLTVGAAAGPASALVHERMPGDDVGGGAALHAAPAIGEDAPMPVHGDAPSLAPEAPSAPVAAAVA